MDIFTTQLTRVVQTPIRPENLKVKALLKESASSKLDQDPDHLENHKHYLISEDKSSEHKQPKQGSNQGSQGNLDKKNKADTLIEADEDEVVYEKHGSEVCIETKHDDDTKHLDLYA